MSICAILFDKDGTLVDFHRTWSPAADTVMRQLAGGDPQLLASLAAAVHFDCDELLFRPTSPFIAGSNHDIAAIWAPVLARSDVATLAKEVGMALRMAAIVCPIGSPPEVFAALARRGLKLGIATNDAEETARRQIEELGLAAHVEFIAGFDSGYGGKPEPGMVHAFAERIGMPVRDVALVGDSIHDLEAARRAGAVAIAVLSGPASRSDLAPHADHMVETIADLPDLVDRLRTPPPRLG